MEQIIDEHIDAWDPIGIADCDAHEYDIEVREICRRLSAQEIIRLDVLTKIIHDVFAEYFGRDIFSRRNTFAETRTTAEKIFTDLAAHGVKVSDEYEISAEEKLENLRLEELKTLTETYRDKKLDLNVPFTFRLLVEMIFNANDWKHGKEVAEKILAAYDTPEKILQAGFECVSKPIKSYANIRPRINLLFKISELLVENYGDKLPATFNEFFRIMNLNGFTIAHVKYNLIRTSYADFDKHVLRTSNRTKIAEGETLYEIRRSLQTIKTSATWHEIFYLLFWHGQEFCTESESKCTICPLSKICPSGV